ncbi:MAG: YibE/F family protein [Actinobacteria bacterium]|nr:YibE/F family protein [Actinomycetota bacterium]
MAAPHAHSAGTDRPPSSDRARRLLALLLVPFAVATAIGVAVLWPGTGGSPLAPELGAPEELFDAEIVSVERGACTGTPPEADIRCARAQARLLEGPDEGQVIQLQEQSEAGSAPLLQINDVVVLGYYPGAGGGFEYSFADRQRRVPLAILTLIFMVAVVGLGRWKGLRAILGLGISLLVLTAFVLPAILQGTSPLAVALVGSTVIAAAALYLAHGVNAWTTTALIGTLVSLALVGVLASVFVDAAQFTGLADEEATFLQVTAGQVDLRGLLLGGIVIGALGVLDDVTVTQVSAVWELHEAKPDYGRWNLYRAAVRIGRDHIASTVNTLVLAYAGASLPLFLLFTQANQGLLDVVNGEAVAVEVVRTLAGSVGLVASVPLTTALAVVVVTEGGGRVARRRKDERRSGDPRRFRSRAEERFWDRNDPPARNQDPAAPPPVEPAAEKGPTDADER